MRKIPPSNSRKLNHLFQGPWINCCVVDELHMIGDGIRGARLESAISKLIFCSLLRNRFCQIIGMSATLPNLPEIATYLRAELYTSDFRPVPLTQYLKIDKFIYKVGRGSEI